MPEVPNQWEILQDVTSHFIKHPSFLLYLSLLSIWTNFFGSIDEMMKDDPEKNFSTEELALLFGLFIQDGNSTSVGSSTKEEIEEILNIVWRDFQRIHHSMMVTPLSEVIFYSNSGAYDFQFIEFFEKRFSRDEEWIKQKKWFSLKTPGFVFDRIKEVQLRKLKSADSSDLRTYFDALCFSIDDLNSDEVPRHEILAFLECFSLTLHSNNERIAKVGDRNIVYERPILKLDENNFYLPLWFLLAQAIYREPISWMIREDLTYFNAIGNKNRGDSAEDMAFNLLSEVFGPENTFKNIDIINTSGETVAEIDILVFVGSKWIVFQVKSKTLTAVARQGNVEKIESDYKAAILHAHKQGELCKNAFSNREFTYKNKDKSIFNKPDCIDEIFVVCLTSDVFPGSLILWKLFFNSDEVWESPIIPISLFDIEVLAHYLKDPFEFLFYIKQRTTFAKHILSGSELAILWTHLESGLYIEDEGLMYTTETCQNWLQAHFLYSKGKFPPGITADLPISKWKNEHFFQLLRQLKETGNIWFTDAILFLYGMSGDCRDDIFEWSRTFLDEMRKIPTKKFKWGAMVFKKDVVAVLCANNLESLEEEMFIYGEAKKYQAHADSVLVVGFIVQKWLEVVSVWFRKQPWSFNPEMEKEVEKYNQITNARSFSVKEPIQDISKFNHVKRKQPCPCGSGKKYKRCCGK